MKYDFDLPIERRGTNCVKWDEEAPRKTGGLLPSEGQDLIPMWVADMDFAVAPAIQRAVEARAKHPVYGYTIVGEAYYNAVISWFHRRHGWDIQRESMLYTTGVVPAISAILRAVTLPGEKVLIQTPVYNCFFSSVRNQGCEVLPAPLCVKDGKYTVEFDDFEQKCADEKTTAFVLCNPHNPVGRVWTRDELQRMADICRKYHVTIISDEIHCELTMPGIDYVPMATVCPEAIVCTSASKSFNLAGLQMANIVCVDPEIRRRIDRVINIHEICDVNCFAAVAQIAAYNEGEEWLDQLRQYLKDNYDALCTFFSEHLSQLKVMPLEGTYLVWVDVRSLGLSADELCDRLLNEQNVWLNAGSMYGADGFVRINIACPRSRLMEGLQRIATAIKSIIL